MADFKILKFPSTKQEQPGITEFKDPNLSNQDDSIPSAASIGQPVEEDDLQETLSEPRLDCNDEMERSGSEAEQQDNDPDDSGRGELGANFGKTLVENDISLVTRSEEVQSEIGIGIMGTTDTATEATIVSQAADLSPVETILQPINGRFVSTPKIDKPAKPELEALDELKSDINDESTSNDRQTPLAPLAVHQVDEIVNDCLAEDGEQYAEDEKRLDAIYSEYSEWCGRVQSLSSSIEAICAQSIAILESAATNLSMLSELSRDALSGRQEGLESIGRMIGRLPEQIGKLDLSVQERPILYRLDKQSLANLLSEETELPPEAAGTSEVKRVSLSRWQMLSNLTSSLESKRKSFLQSIKNYVLPVIDGLDKGESITRSEVSKLKESNEDEADRLSDWLQSYAECRGVLLSLLSGLGVQPMADAVRGNPIDFERHEPIMDVEDHTLGPEQISEVVFNGYEITASPDSEPLLVRAAQVVAVKNEGDKNA